MYKLIDLFAGAGGMTLGFTNLKNSNGKSYFNPIWANDFDKSAVATYNHNFEGNHCVHGDINDLLANPDVIIPKVDVVIGGPPCQGFSLLNKNREGDARKELWLPYMEVIEKSEAKIFVMENVPQLLGSDQYNEIVEHAERLGFKVAPGQKLLAANYGVPQMRYRAIIIGSKIGDPNRYFPPSPTHRNPKDSKSNLPAWNTVKSAIEDLPIPIGTEIRSLEDNLLTLHFGRNPTPTSLARYKSIPEEGMNRFDLQRVAPELTPKCWINKKSGGTDLFGRLWWDRPSVTIRTEFFKPEKGRYLHPEQHRPITHREAARLQTFPDDFTFKGSKIDIAKQIGNAVPPKFAEAIASIVLKLLSAPKKKNNQEKAVSDVQTI